MAVTLHRTSSSNYVVADCDVADILGDMVHISAPPVVGIRQVTKLDLDAAAPIHIPLGMITRKQSTTRCTVQTDGEIDGDALGYGGLTPGQALFVGRQSRLGHDPPPHPMSPTTLRVIHPAGVALSATALHLRVQSPVKIRAQ